MRLCDKFLQDFHERVYFTTKEARAWYLHNKKGHGDVYAANVYLILINPLIREGFVQRVTEGSYRFVDVPVTVPEDPDTQTSESEIDEFDAYIANKLKEARD